MRVTEATKPWQRRASPLARYTALVYTGLIVYASLHPFHGWHDLGISPWAYLTAPPQRHLFTFDVLANVAAYIPLGFIWLLALYPRVRGWAAIVLVTILGSALSAGMEALQTFLLPRVSSNIDLLCNSAGALTGAIFASFRVSALLDRGALLAYRLRWFERHASGGLILLGLWLFALLYPKPLLFGLGDVLKPVLEWFNSAFDTTASLNDFYHVPLDVYPWIEGVIAGCQIAGSCWLLASLLRPLAPRKRLLLLWGTAAFAFKTLSHGLLTGPEQALSWLTPGAQYGLAGGLLAALLIDFGRARSRRILAAAALTCALLLVNFTPENIYLEVAQQEWNPGRFLNFSGTTQWLAALWPFAALIYLTRKRHGNRRRQDQ